MRIIAIIALAAALTSCGAGRGTTPDFPFYVQCVTAVSTTPPPQDG